MILQMSYEKYILVDTRSDYVKGYEHFLERVGGGVGGMPIFGSSYVAYNVGGTFHGVEFYSSSILGISIIYCKAGTI